MGTTARTLITAIALVFSACGAAQDESVSDLIKKLGEDGVIKNKAMGALANLGDRAVPQLIETLQSKDESLALRAAYTLGMIGTEELKAQLRELYQNHPKDEWRKFILVALGVSARGEEENILLAADALNDKNPSVRYAATEAISVYAETTASDLEALRKNLNTMADLLKDEDPRVRESAYNALEKLTDFELPIVPKLAALLDDTREDIQLNAAILLVNIKPISEGVKQKLLTLKGTTKNKRIKEI